MSEMDLRHGRQYLIRCPNAGKDGRVHTEYLPSGLEIKGIERGLLRFGICGLCGKTMELVVKTVSGE